MAKLRFYPMDITYKVINGEPVIHMYGRTVEGEQLCIVDHYEPYFWAVGDIKAIEKQIDETVARTEVVKKDLNGEIVDAVKIITMLPEHVPKMKDKLKETALCLEADILFARRYLIDKEIIPCQEYEIEAEPYEFSEGMKAFELKSIKPAERIYENQKILAFDIETLEQEDAPIIMFSLYGKDFQKVVTWKHFPTKEKYIEFVNSEADLIKRFRELVKEHQPDIITGYFSDGFDFPYIMERAKKYKLSIDISLDKSQPVIGRGENKSTKLTGINHVDVYKFVRNILRLDVDDYTLNSVAEALLKDRKHDVDFEKLPDAWKTGDGLEKFCQYNLHDSKLTYELCSKLLPNIVEMVRIVGVPMYDICRMALSQLVEWYLIRNAPKFNTLVPNRPAGDEFKTRLTRKYKGAFVFEPKPGLYNNIMLFDFRSLYPSIIASHNISPSTMNCSCCRDTAERVPFEKDEPGKIWFCTNKKGFISSMIGDLIERRMRIKEIMKKEKNPLLDARQYSLKLLANSFYGYLGFYAARWYCYDCARSITAYGRDYIHKVIKQFETEGFKVIYSDTDSIFVTTGKKKAKDAQDLAHKINKSLPGIMELEYEGNFPSGIFVSLKGTESGAKKKYALIDENDEIVIKGFETVRSNWSPVAKDVQKKVLTILLKEGDAEKALKYVKKIIENIRKHELGKEEFEIRTQLTKPVEEYESTAPHVAVAKRLIKEGHEIVPGMVIKYIITSGKGTIGSRARVTEQCSNEDYDADYYIENQVVPSVIKIFEVFGYSEKDLAEKGAQDKLSKFF